MVAKLIRGLHNVVPSMRGGIITIGNFDGVHEGHKALLMELKKKAMLLKRPSIVITFEPQPLEFFTHEKKIARLTRWREKYAALAETGIDFVLVIRFNQEFASLTADEFIQKIVINSLNASHVMVGDDFRFGLQRAGDFNFLVKAGHQKGFTVENMDSVLINNERVSSTKVRELLASGDHVSAERLLGRPYTMMGRVVHGDKLGRTLGFPTANIYLHRKATPLHGIYVVRMHGVEPRGLPGVANVGTRPTIGGTRALLEVYLFNFDRDIYGKPVAVEFCKKIRDEKHFASLDLLKEAISQDADEARHYFEERGEL